MLPRTRHSALGPGWPLIRLIPALVVIVSCGDKPEDLSAAASAAHIRQSIVRIAVQEGGARSSGTGFFIEHDSQRYVVTNLHVIGSGGAITVERRMELDDSDYYLEAYPETRVVAFDERADLALIELRSVPPEKMPPLKFGIPQRDMPVASYGFPASNLVGQLGLTSQSGSVTGIVDLPTLDPITHEQMGAMSYKGIIVSTAIEPGFSGGPTVDERGGVVGVNVIKDAGHAGQNGPQRCIT